MAGWTTRSHASIIVVHKGTASLKALLTQFVGALEAEIALIEKESRDQTYDLVSGQREEGATGALYVFVLADPLRLPEDSVGTLKVGSSDYSAAVVAQEGNRIWVLVESGEALPEQIAFARLVLDETDLLRRLKEKMEEMSASGDVGMAPKVFGLESASIGRVDVPEEITKRLDPDKRGALQQCLGSEVTFLWGPPGTGKTFSIASLVACLVPEETVLVTSHTHAAVEQALFALIEPPATGRPGGLLHDSALVSEGRILKVGPKRDPKIPPEVHLDSYLEQLIREREENIGLLRTEHETLARRLEEIEAHLELWRALAHADSSRDLAEQRLADADAALRQALAGVAAARTGVTGAKNNVETAKRSFILGRRGRIERAARAAMEAEHELAEAQAKAGNADAAIIRKRLEVDEVAASVARAQEATQGLQDPSLLEEQASLLTERLVGLSEEIEALQGTVDEGANELIEHAAAIFATLTKLYTDRTKVGEMKWDTVIIDEASMAMPPLVAYAASRAKKRVVIVGDMYQLSPIVHSDPGTGGGLLAIDIFESRGITDSLDQGTEVAELAKLTTQRRMHPEIAAVAKHLIDAYANLRDHPDTQNHRCPDLVEALGVTPSLLVVDTAGFRPWCGKMPGSLSRFNFVSAQVAVEVAALYATCIEKAGVEAGTRVGIVTPYAAQRRYLSKLVGELGLQEWVTAGTVHTFQGNECDVIIFDSVLGEPHWTARLTNPSELKYVRRDLNVAVTRARHQFVFVGDSHWFAKNVKVGSGYGRLWERLASDDVPHLDAPSLLGTGFRERIARASARVHGWTIDGLPDKASLLNESGFYPAFIEDLARASRRVVLYTPFIGKTRWPLVEPHILALRERDVEVYILHKPLSDREWRQGDPGFGQAVFERLEAAGVHLVPVSGVHAKTISIDSEIIYEGSLNWASQTNSYEHMWRFKSKDMALLVERMLQLEPLTRAYDDPTGEGSVCPNCGGPLILINQAQLTRTDANPVKLGCQNFAEDKSRCTGYLRRIDGRPPFKRPPLCQRGSRMRIAYAKSGRPWAWKCGHSSCTPIRWARGDCEA